MSHIYIVRGEHPGEDSGYYLGSAETEEDARRVAVAAIAVRVGGEWDEYRAKDVKTLQRAVEGGHLARALNLWNRMSGFQITIEEIPFGAPHLGTMNFQWPEAP